MFVKTMYASALSAALMGFGLLFPLSATLAAEEAVEPMDPSVIIAYTENVYLTQAELDAAFNKVPEPERLTFIRDGAKVDALIQSLIKLKTLANDARKAGFDQQPLMPETIALAADKELAEDWLYKVVMDAPAPDFEQMAREEYLANPDKFRTEVVLDISHILIGNQERSNRDAEQLALLLVERLENDPALFDELVMEYSDDPAKTMNKGRYPDMRKGQMVSSFEKAAFDLMEPGQISEPVKTEYGFHIIRLNERLGNELPEFETIKDKVVIAAKEEYYENYQATYLRKLLTSPIVIPEGAVEIMAKRHFGENLELAPEFDEDTD